MLAGLSPARRRLVLALAALVAVVAAVLAVALVSRSSAPAGEPADQRRPGPVLLVPGYGGGTDGLQTLAERLTAAGRDTTVVALPGNGTGDLRASAEALDREVTAALARTGAESVDVVGYSAGGLVARLWVTDGGA
ncbi:MAG TPA: alpha/beta fold hydrolase, partial [Mycobacteriales bacterium]|nr:alpha/beta fold hydrolase [Mycobacteriales bacterium]